MSWSAPGELSFDYPCDDPLLQLEPVAPPNCDASKSYIADALPLRSWLVTRRCRWRCYYDSGVSTDTPSRNSGAQEDEGGLAGQQRVSMVLRNGRWMGARNANTAGTGASHDQQMTEQRLMQRLAGVPGLQQGLQRMQAQVCCD